MCRTPVALMTSLHVQYHCWPITVVNEFKSPLLHHSAEAASIEDSVTDIGLMTYGIPQSQSVMEKLLTEQPFIAINL